MRPGHRACVGAASIGRLPTAGARALGALGPRLRGVARTGGRRTRCGFVACLRRGRSGVVGRVGPLLRVGTGAGRPAIGRRAACLPTALTGRLRGARTGRQVDGRGRPLGTGDEGTRLRGSSVVAPLGMPSAVLIRPGGRVAVGDCAGAALVVSAVRGAPTRVRGAGTATLGARAGRAGTSGLAAALGAAGRDVADQRRACRARHQRRMRPPPRRDLESRPGRGRAPSHGRSRREPGRGRAHRCRHRDPARLRWHARFHHRRRRAPGHHDRCRTLRTTATGTAGIRRAALGGAAVGPETAGLAATRRLRGTLGTTGGLAVLGPVRSEPTAVGRPAVGGAALGRRAAGCAAIGTGASDTPRSNALRSDPLRSEPLRSTHCGQTHCGQTHCGRNRGQTHCGRPLRSDPLRSDHCGRPLRSDHCGRPLRSDHAVDHCGQTTAVRPLRSDHCGRTTAVRPLRSDHCGQTHCGRPLRSDPLRSDPLRSGTTAQTPAVDAAVNPLRSDALRSDALPRDAMLGATASAPLRSGAPRSEPCAGAAVVHTAAVRDTA
jgi:hypothetical protein